ncbi:MAG: hypothetical protein ACHQ1G_00175 [Planctomycetota bacterium]
MKTGRRFVKRDDGTYEETYASWYWWAMGAFIVLYLLAAAFPS